MRDHGKSPDHCRDCCCAESWKALGVTEYDGKSIPEHITALQAELTSLKEEALPVECGDCRYCVLRDDHIPGCDHPIGAEQAEAELAALKARRCETCKLATWYEKSIFGSCIRVSHINPDDVCSEWQAQP